MPLTGSQPALMQARFGIARFGATRFGYIDPVNVVLLIAGIDRSQFVEKGSLTVSQPDTATFRLDPEVPFDVLDGQTVQIGLGSSRRLIFGGQIDVLGHDRRQGDQTPWLTVPCIDWQRLFNRRKVTYVWTNTTATQIAVEIIEGWTSGFTRVNVVPDLPTIEHFPAEDAEPFALLRTLANLIGGASFIDPYRDVNLFGADGPMRSVTNPRTLVNGRASLERFRHSNNPTQLRTRVTVQGKGTTVLLAISASETVIPVDTVEMFDSDGGDAKVAQELIAYTGVVTGGAGSLVGPGVRPSSWLVPTPKAGAGLTDGFYLYGFTWVTAAGETLVSPLHGMTAGPMASPTVAPARAATSGSGLGAGTYLYAVTFVVGAGETTPGPTGSVVTSDGIDAPSTSGSASASWFPGETHTGGRYSPGDAVYARCSYVDANGNETGGTDTNTVTVGGGPASVLFSGLPIPTDPRVVLKRLYLNVNGSFVAYKELAAGTYAESWADAGTTVGSFPIGGDPELRQVTLTSIPLGSTGTTARKIYRTDVGGSTLKLVTTIADNTTATYVDSTADGSLGATAPSANTTVMNQGALSIIAVGPSGVTSRKVYRTVAGGSTLKLVTTIADNTTTTYDDSTADGSLGADAPSGDTSGLTQQQGQVNAGATTIPVAGPGAFSPSGGWARLGDQVVRYTGVSGSNLTGVPSSGVGSLMATVNYGATIAEAPRLTGVSGLAHALTKGVDIHLRVTRNDTTAQAIRALIEGGDGIHEYVISDDKLSLESAAALAQSDLDAFSRALVAGEWDTEDMNALAGRSQAIAFGAPDVLEATLTLTGVELTFPVPNKRPMRHVQASTVKTAGLIDVLATGGVT